MTRLMLAVAQLRDERLTSAKSGLRARFLQENQPDERILGVVSSARYMLISANLNGSTCARWARGRSQRCPVPQVSALRQVPLLDPSGRRKRPVPGVRPPLLRQERRSTQP